MNFKVVINKPDGTIAEAIVSNMPSAMAVICDFLGYPGYTVTSTKTPQQITHKATLSAVQDIKERLSWSI